MAPAPPAERESIAQQDSHDIVDFDETLPVTDSMRADLYARATPSAPPRALLAPVSEPPARPASVKDSGPPLPLVNRTGGPGLIAPVVMPPQAPRPAMAPPPAPDSVPPSIPRAPPPSSRSFGTAGAVSTPRPTPGAVVTPLESPLRGSSMPTDPPPEMDGSSKRRRMVRFMLAGLILFVVGLTWTVVRSQLDAGAGSPVPSGTMPTETAPPPPPPEPPRPTTTAIDPGMKATSTRPGKPVPTAPIHRGPYRPRQPKQDDGTIVVPDPDAVPAAP
jgi:hypothetical protein